MTNTFERLTSALADRYTIERELGTGGMATVYLAHDIKHDRKVATKVLRPELAAVLGTERFLNEIKVTANLSHPHILPLLDSGRADSRTGTETGPEGRVRHRPDSGSPGEFLYYVMPYVEGESLREKVSREKQLSIEEALEITKSVASALDYAHRQNVIHRDIKPENILLHDGQPVVADFGISLAVSAAGGTRLTETGLSLGTPQYMSPEQATGDREVDARSDVYSLACVLYELLSGEPPHTGRTVEDVIALVVSDRPRFIAELRDTVPLNVAAAIHKALSKLPADRFGGAADFSRALVDQSFTTLATAGGARGAGGRGLWNPLSKTLALVSFLLLLTSAWPLLRGPATRPLPTYDVGLPDSAPMAITDWKTSLSAAPSGEFVVYRAERETRDELWYRSLVDTTVYPIPGTVGALALAVSPASDEVAFATLEALKLVPVEGGTVRTLAELAHPGSVRWVSETEILLLEGDGSRLRWIDVRTGQERLREGKTCWAPQPLPTGDRVVCSGGGWHHAFVIDFTNATKHHVRIRTAAGSGSPTYLRGTDFRLVENKYLTYMSLDGDLRAAPFDTETLEAGHPVTLVAGVRRQSFSGYGQYSVGDDGTLVFVQGVNADIGRLVSWHEGEEPTPFPLEPAMFRVFDVSPDARSLAIVAEVANGEELRVYDLTTGQFQPLLHNLVIGAPSWTPDGDIIVAARDLETNRWVLTIGPPNPLAARDTLFSGSGDHRYSVTGYYGAEHLIGEVWGDHSAVLRIDLAAGGSQIDTILTEAVFATLSPDRTRLLYQPIGLGQIVVTPYPALEPRVPVAHSGGEPHWLSNTELVYAEAGGRFFRLSIGRSVGAATGMPRHWYTDPLYTETPARSYQVTDDGGLVYVRSLDQKSPTYLRVIPNWVEQMKRAVDEANKR